MCRVRQYGASSIISLRGILALMIVFHHFQVLYSSDFTWLGQAGFWGVPVCVAFFLFSGYGLMSSFQTKGSLYLNNFVIRRALVLFVPTIILVLSDQLLRFIVDNGFSMQTISNNMVHGIIFLPHLWFVCILYIFYLIFYLSWKISNNFLVFVGAFLLFYSAFITFVNYYKWGAYWYTSGYGFVIGVLLAKFKEICFKFCCSFPLFIVLFICFVAILLYGSIGSVQQSLFAWGSISYLMIPVILFVCTIVAPIKEMITTWLGRYSMEIYLVHVSAMWIVNQYVKPGWILIGGVVVVTLIGSFCLKKMALMVYKRPLYN